MDYNYLSSIFKYIGIIINVDLKQEIIYYFPLVFIEKKGIYEFKNSYEFIAQPLGTFFVDFINTNFDIIDEFKEFFLKYSFCLLDSNYKKSFNKSSYTIDEFEEFINRLYLKKLSSLKKLQKQIDEIIDYCIRNPKKKNANLTALDRFLVLQTIHENFTILQENRMETITFYRINDHILSNKSENELYTLLLDKQNTVQKFIVHTPTNIETFLYFILCNIMENKLFLKVCKNCSRYFISKNSKIDYCDRLAPFSDKTCKEIGRKNTFMSKLENDILLERYYRIYRRKSILATRNPDIKEYVKDFENYKKIGKNKISSYKSKKLSEEELKMWLDKKDKLL